MEKEGVTYICKVIPDRHTINATVINFKDYVPCQNVSFIKKILFVITRYLPLTSILKHISTIPYCGY